MLFYSSLSFSGSTNNAIFMQKIKNKSRKNQNTGKKDKTFASWPTHSKKRREEGGKPD